MSYWDGQRWVCLDRRRRQASPTWWTRSCPPRCGWRPFSSSPSRWLRSSGHGNAGPGPTTASWSCSASAWPGSPSTW